MPVLNVPSVLNNCNAHITSAFGVAEKALATVRLVTFPAEVVTDCFSTLTFSDQ